MHHDTTEHSRDDALGRSVGRGRRTVREELPHDVGTAAGPVRVGRRVSCATHRHGQGDGRRRVVVTHLGDADAIVRRRRTCPSRGLSRRGGAHDGCSQEKCACRDQQRGKREACSSSNGPTGKLHRVPPFSKTSNVTHDLVIQRQRANELCRDTWRRPDMHRVLVDGNANPSSNSVMVHWAICRSSGSSSAAPPGRSTPPDSKTPAKQRTRSAARPTRRRTHRACLRVPPPPAAAGSRR